MLFVIVWVLSLNEFESVDNFSKVVYNFTEAVYFAEAAAASYSDKLKHVIKITHPVKHDKYFSYS